MRRLLLTAVFCAAFIAQASWATTTWTEFNSVGSGTVTGTMGGVTVTYSSSDLNWAQINNTGTNWWLCGATPCAAYYAPGITPPDNVDMISINGTDVEHTITFSSPVTNPIMALISLGEPSIYTTYYFDQNFSILSDGPGWWGGPGTLNLVSGNGLQGIEGDGLIQFNGTFNQITWTGGNEEYWNGFNVATTPEPSSLLLLGSGLLGGLGVIRRKLNR